jgi:phosphinothricin acetyltransferase
VAEANGRVVATTYPSSFFGGRPAYDATAEISYHRRGIGRRLKEFVIGECPRLGLTKAAAVAVRAGGRRSADQSIRRRE